MSGGGGEMELAVRGLGWSSGLLGFTNRRGAVLWSGTGGQGAQVIAGGEKSWRRIELTGTESRRKSRACGGRSWGWWPR